MESILVDQVLTVSTFTEIVKRRFLTGYTLSNEEKYEHISSCYTHLQCHRGPLPACLDWREICDGKVDCFDGGQDEQNCWQLEMNECDNNNQYRCHNGAQCIPNTFYNDNKYNPDCLDGSDEDYSELENRFSSCHQDPTFRCEEHMCPRSDLFSCGDGNCVPIMIPNYGDDCRNFRDIQLSESIVRYKEYTHLSSECWWILIYGIDDCFDGEDETFKNSCSLNDVYRYHCPDTDDNCISPILVRDGEENCEGDELTLVERARHERPQWPLICDTYEDIEKSDRYNETDETNCDASYWPCNNIYTHCDGTWNCPNGVDEIDCPSNSICSPNGHLCLSLVTYELTCLPLSLAGNGKVDCRGGTDERMYCRRNLSIPMDSIRYRCRNSTTCTSMNNVCPDAPLPGETDQCFCPPSYFGNRCQYQNQRISLTIQFRLTQEPERQTVFHILILIISNNESRYVQSSEQIIYIPMYDCMKKFNIYLLYPSIPKDSTKNYSIHIDAFDKTLLMYRASWYLSIPFQFLPVNRLATQLTIPRKALSSCHRQCGLHGQCTMYVNTDKSFCRCDSGWSGKLCNIAQNCTCSSNSLCIDGSICVCGLDHFGPHCLLTRSVCSTGNICANGGLCVPVDQRIAEGQSTCLCTEGFSGPTCEQLNSKITLSFDGIAIPPSILLHFVRIFDGNAPHERTTIFKKIRMDYETISIYRSDPFHILFTEFFNNYYLTILQQNEIISNNISTIVLPSHRCRFIDELLDKTRLVHSILRRIKYYHSICREWSDLSCFYDSIYMCLCTIDRQANCFDFDHNMIYDCVGQNHCENDGQCFQDHPSCPTTSICACKQCYFGSKCQLSTQGNWLNACVAIERTLTVFKGIDFNKKKSRRIAKWIIFILILLTIISHIQDSIHRQLIDDDEEQRTWCIVKYSHLIHVIDSTINIIHIIVPFCINFISALLIIIITARTKSNIYPEQTYKQHLRQQFKKNKHLLISSFILILLALPRLIISFVSKCMQSARDPWLFLIGYFVSFIPPMLLFFVFVLPSDVYKKEFYKSIKRVTTVLR
ncbi:unnamed protein product [Rotaria sp. Silwood1]|nr:unnamed protein product [Rotaria sp. Silwood1]